MNGDRLQIECRGLVVKGVVGHPAPRLSVIALALSIALGGTAVALPATVTAQTVPSQQQFSVPAGTLREALDALASQSGITVLYSSELVMGKTTRGLSGRYAPSEALRRLLQDSGLEAKDAGDSTYTLRRSPAPASGSKVLAGKVPASAQPPAQEEVQELEKMTVTGSRIARAGFDTLEPATVVTREFLDDFGFTNVADGMVTLPSFNLSPSTRGFQSNFGGGVNFLGRFGLGSNRMLTLVNGRRFVTSNPPTTFGPGENGVQVDLNAIPSIMIDRVESIGIGGAPTYGSDAISGVSNYILRENFEGAEVRLGFGQTSKGDNERQNWSAVVGSNFAQDRGNITFALTFDNSDGLLGRERDFYRQSYSEQQNPLQSNIDRFQPGRDAATDGRIDPSIPFNTGNGDGIYNSIWIRNQRLHVMTTGGLVIPDTVGVSRNFYRDVTGQPLGFGPNNTLVHFDPNGNLVPYNPGMTFGTSGAASGGDGADTKATTPLLANLSRKSVYANGNFAFSENVRGFFEASWYGSTYSEVENVGIWNTSLFGAKFADGTGAADGSLPFNINNPFLTDQARSVLQGLGVTNFRLSRLSNDFSLGNKGTETTIARLVLGVDGYFQFGGRDYNWEVSATHGRADFDYQYADVLNQNFVNALNVTRNSSGQIVCDPTAAGAVYDPDCRPLNLFGEGVATREALAYIRTMSHSSAETRQSVINANLSGSLFRLPGGSIAYNIGFEHRREEGAFSPDDYWLLGLGRANPVFGVRGDYSTNEYFAEAMAPLVNPESGIPGLHRLDLTAKVRRVDNTVNGWFTAHTLGLQYEPLPGIQLRGNRTESFRAPSIPELFTSMQPASFTIPELCTRTNIASGTKPAIRERNCNAFFAAYPDVDPATFSARGVPVKGTRNGNPALGNEQAKSWTAGIVLNPEWLGGLRVAADWYEIDITNVISLLSASNVVSGCFDNDEFDPTDVDNANRFCSMISRDPLTGVSNGMATEYSNGPLRSFRGWTSEVNYRHDLDRFGHLALGFTGYFPKSMISQPAAGIPAANSVGTTGTPEKQYQWSARYVVGNWNAGVTANYQSSALISLTAAPDSRQYLRMDSYTTWNASLGYQASDRARLNLSVINATDNIGPFPFVIDALGRRYMATISYSFK